MATAEINKSSLMSLSSNTLDFHLRELEEECARFVALINALRSTWNDETRDVLEGDLYGSLAHLKNHVRPALKEWDRLVEELPDDDEDSDE
ncbi:MAG TPA: hypothetical protein VJZ91_03630 [Blastocatellia bacterium]|nr:hypothetical protein [Blastocatellia bacterium]